MGKTVKGAIMGYESRLYVVDKSGIKMDVNGAGEYRYGEIVATFDLSKVYDISDRMRNYPATDCFIYVGDEETIEDLYGAPLKEVPIADAIKIIEDATEADGYVYRRYKPCLGLLKGFDTDEWTDLVVLHYGY